ncbi:MAG: nucleotidyltransferase substrate binding protein [Ignavibacteriae bacterium]|nr:nucleotidyltransferase substrate binding protein [Ignavibacteriota bacterium]
MNEKTDIRWKQRFQNYENSFQYLKELTIVKDFSEIEIDATIQRFEVAYELAWKTLQDFLEEQGYDGIKGQKKVIIKSFQDMVIEQGET